MSLETESAAKVEERRRLEALSPEKQNMFTQIVSGWEGRFSNAERDRRRTFALAFLETPTPDLLKYANKPQTFPVERFQIRCLIGPEKAFHDLSEHWSYALETLSDCELYLDVPFAFVFLYNRVHPSQGEESWEDWEPISVVSFLPDIRNELLLVHQLQGGDTERVRASNKARRARMRLKIRPEQILYSLVLDLAVRTNLRTGIKGGNFGWTDLEAKILRGGSTPYSQIIEERGLGAEVWNEFCLEPLDERDRNKEISTVPKENK